MTEQPIQLGVPAKEPVIYTIPEQFYGLAAKAQLPKEAVPMPAQPSVPGTPAPAPSRGESKRWLLIPILAIVFLAGLGFAAWWFLQPKQAPAPASTPVTQPTPTPAPQPAPVPEPAPQPAPATTTIETPAAPAPEADSDGDGLTNAEEALYGTNPGVADTDSDGFNDSVEVINLYNPAGFKPTKLIDAGLVKPYDAAGFEVLYPTAWTPIEGGAAGRIVSFAANANETITIDEQDNAARQSALDWFLSKNTGASPAQVQSFTTKSGLEGVRDPGTSTAYIVIADKTFIFTDTALDQSKRSFASTFTMMINSFTKKP